MEFWMDIIQILVDIRSSVTFPACDFRFLNSPPVRKPPIPPSTPPFSPMGSPSALKRPINSSSPRPDAVPPFEQEQRPDYLTPSPDLMNRQHNKRRSRFMNHTSTLKTFSEKDEELERR